MAQPIRFATPPRDSRAMLRERVEHAPEQHAEALLAAYDLLQALHDRGILDVARSALLASDELLHAAVDAANTPAALRAIRNLLFWQEILGSIEPKWFKGLVQAVPEGLATATAERNEPVRPWRLLRRGLSRGRPRGLAPGVAFLVNLCRPPHSVDT